MFSQLHVAGILSFQPRTGTASFTSPVERICQQTKGPAHTYGVEQFPLMPAYSNRLQFPGRTITGKGNHGPARSLLVTSGPPSHIYVM